MEKNAAKNPWFLDFPCPIPTTVQKGSASNRLYTHPRCRSRAPRGSALPRRGRRPRRPASPPRRIPAYFRLPRHRGGVLPRSRFFRRVSVLVFRPLSVLAPRRGRRPRRPAHVSTMSPAGRAPRPRARVTFGRSPKSDQKVCLKPQVSRLPARLGYVKNLSPRPPRSPKLLQIVVQRIAYDPLIAAAPTFRAKTFYSRAAQ